MRERILDIWPIWKFPSARKTSVGFLLSMAFIDVMILAPFYLITNHLMGWVGHTVLDPTTSLDLAIPFMAWTVSAKSALMVIPVHVLAPLHR